jgi:uncharacterized protein YyaL (SSP411 family)
MPTLKSCSRPTGEVIALLWLLGVAASTLPAATAEEKSVGWRLAAESSPYLRMHAGNPVEWFPWGEAAFEKARREDKPLFISIGYFTCHWCHVMARESFENPAIATLLNEHFVAVKIDREQRPDLDAAYMSYVMATSGRGGWPLTVWATPEGHPFTGGTYFPPEAARGSPGLRQLLDKIGALWDEDPEAVRHTGRRAVALLRKQHSPVAPLSQLSAATLVEARRQIAAVYDELQGGFGPAPKFPEPARLLFLLQDPPQASADMALHTLDRMAAGGIHDRLGGGFHRYSTDFDWRVPHFEKMLYDQALLARAYLYAWRRSGAEHQATVAREILDFVLEEMRAPEGGFYSALGADSPVAGQAAGPPEEGGYYTWDWRQLNDALGSGMLLDWAAARYGLTEHGNAASDPSGELAGRNVLYQAADTPALARRFGVDLITARQRNAEVDRRLRESRRQRPAVPVDDKVVTVWNGYMITTLALAGRILDEPRYCEAAARTAGFVLEALYDEEPGILYRDWRQGVRGVPGFAEDYAALAEGLLTLYKVTAERRWLRAARRLADTLLLQYWDETNGGFYATRADSGLWLRGKQASDGASLSVNGIAVQVLVGLGTLTWNRQYHEKARQTAAWAGAQLQDAPGAMPYLLIRWTELLHTGAAGQGDD